MGGPKKTWGEGRVIPSPQHCHVSFSPPKSNRNHVDYPLCIFWWPLPNNSSNFTLVIVLVLSRPLTSKKPETFVKNYFCLARSPKSESLGIKTRNSHFQLLLKIFEYLTFFWFWLTPQKTAPLFFFFFWPCHTAHRILVPLPGIKPVPPAVKMWRSNHWTTREFPKVPSLKIYT